MNPNAFTVWQSVQAWKPSIRDVGYVGKADFPNAPHSLQVLDPRGLI